MRGSPWTCCEKLLDHVSVQTTMGYYSVSLKRKRQAIATVGSLRIRHEPRTQHLARPARLRARPSVSVPFDNCTEPANVRAGGGHCPIRFQSAGCSFYRPESLLPSGTRGAPRLVACRPGERACDECRCLRAFQLER